ncbi:MAG: formylglycine-generating enzyme family protein [Deltaproteobacteria bacterium]
MMRRKSKTTVLMLFVLVFAGMAIAASPGTDKGSIKTGAIKTVDIGGGVKMDFVWCPPGTFMMGSSRVQQCQAIKALPADLKQDTKQSTLTAIQNEGPQHRVTFTKGFWMAKTEVTQAQWKRVMGNNPSKFKEAGPNAPVETVSWSECHEFIMKLNELPRIRTAGMLRLPTDAEWEYAARAGTQTAYYFGDDSATLGDYAWFAGNSGMKSHPVAQKNPNAWGLFDMHGNVWEWCANWFGPYSPEYEADPQGSKSGPGRVGRGGGWDDFAGDLRAAYRSFGRPADFKASPLGFRPVISEN